MRRLSAIQFPNQPEMMPSGEYIHEAPCRDQQFPEPQRQPVGLLRRTVLTSLDLHGSHS
jgi:hypothetical protein